MTTAFLFTTLSGAAMAGDFDRDKIKDQKQLKDGSCQDLRSDGPRFDLAGRERDKDNIKEKLKDCKGA
jgi:hypothetical protein